MQIFSQEIFSGRTMAASTHFSNSLAFLTFPSIIMYY